MNEKKLPVARYPRLDGWLMVPQAAAILGCTKQNVHKHLIQGSRFKKVVWIGSPDSPIYLLDESEVRELAGE